MVIGESMANSGGIYLCPNTLEINCWSWLICWALLFCLQSVLLIDYSHIYVVKTTSNTSKRYSVYFKNFANWPAYKPREIMLFFQKKINENRPRSPQIFFWSKTFQEGHFWIYTVFLSHLPPFFLGFSNPTVFYSQTVVFGELALSNRALNLALF